MIAPNSRARKKGKKREEVKGSMEEFEEAGGNAVRFLNNVIVRGIWEKKLGTRLFYIIEGC